MRGILINNTIHTGNDLGLVLTSKDLATPKVQTHKVEIPGRNGALDMSEALTGEPTYDNRTLKFSFFGDGSREEVLDLIDIMTNYNGKWVTIIVEDLTDWYYEGRAEVSIKDKYRYVEIDLTIDAQPFRQLVNPKLLSYTNVSALEISINNEGVSIIPTITVSTDTTIVNGDKTYTLSTGTYESEDLILKNGINKWTVTTTGIITISYREAKI